jgi:hypothetical protein
MIRSRFVCPQRRRLPPRGPATFRQRRCLRRDRSMCVVRSRTTRATRNRSATGARGQTPAARGWLWPRTGARAAASQGVLAGLALILAVRVRHACGLIRARALRGIVAQATHPPAIRAAAKEVRTPRHALPRRCTDGIELWRPLTRAYRQGGLLRLRLAAASADEHEWQQEREAPSFEMSARCLHASPQQSMTLLRSRSGRHCQQSPSARVGSQRGFLCIRPTSGVVTVAGRGRHIRAHEDNDTAHAQTRLVRALSPTNVDPRYLRVCSHIPSSEIPASGGQ